MKRLVSFSLAVILLSSTSCHHILWWKKKPAETTPKESSKVATEVEKDFMKRWIEKRSADLVNLGSAPADAHNQAVAEFKDKFGYTEVAKDAK